MLLPLLFAAGHSAPVVPGVSGCLAVVTSGGACSVPDPSKPWLVTTDDAEHTVSWTLTNPAPGYTDKLYRNATLIASWTTPADPGTYVDAPGGAEAGTLGRATHGYTYRVDVVRNSDGAVVSTSSAAAIIATYGTCQEGDDIP